MVKKGTSAVCPQVGGKDLCLSWDLNGQCNSWCKHKDMHKKQYSPDTPPVRAFVHSFLVDCGVPPQALV